MWTKRICLFLAAGFWVSLAPMISFAETNPAARTGESGLKIFYIRHAEGGHNVAADWADVPKDTWPAYVGDPDVFTREGKAQQAAVAGKLTKYDFDFIATSPMWRCRNTILPYLKETESKAETASSS
ncbi:histidine phosphatase family protein [Novipirellula rosea]